MSHEPSGLQSVEDFRDRVASDSGPSGQIEGGRAEGSRPIFGELAEDYEKPARVSIQMMLVANVEDCEPVESDFRRGSARPLAPASFRGRRVHRSLR